LNDFSIRGVLLVSSVALVGTIFGAARASAQPWQGRGQPNGGSPVYQQYPVNGGRRDERWDRRDSRRDSQFASPQVSAGWFQRPYPYHLDYYKNRFNGPPPNSGNLPGTPGVNYPVYYGPYYTGYGGYANAYGQPGYGGVPANPGIIMPGTEVEESSTSQTQTDESKTKAGR
jgi:hypothetical protein